MLYIPCPHCGPRNETEFHYGAEAGVAYPDPNAPEGGSWSVSSPTTGWYD